MGISSKDRALNGFDRKDRVKIWHHCKLVNLSATICNILLIILTYFIFDSANMSQSELKGIESETEGTDNTPISKQDIFERHMNAYDRSKTVKTLNIVYSLIIGLLTSKLASKLPKSKAIGLVLAVLSYLTNRKFLKLERPNWCYNHVYTLSTTLYQSNHPPISSNSTSMTISPLNSVIPRRSSTSCAY